MLGLGWGQGDEAGEADTLLPPELPLGAWPTGNDPEFQEAAGARQGANPRREAGNSSLRGQETRERDLKRDKPGTPQDRNAASVLRCSEL